MSGSRGAFAQKEVVNEVLGFQLLAIGAQVAQLADVAFGYARIVGPIKQFLRPESVKQVNNAKGASRSRLASSVSQQRHGSIRQSGLRAATTGNTTEQ